MVFALRRCLLSKMDSGELRQKTTWVPERYAAVTGGADIGIRPAVGKDPEKWRVVRVVDERVGYVIAANDEWEKYFWPV